jgi:ribose transport system substrate-binding protein
MFRLGLVSGFSVLALVLSSCTGGAGGSSGGDTVPIDVGNDMTVDLSTRDDIKVAVFVPNVADTYGQSQERAVKEVSEELGLDSTVYDAGHDPVTQLTQMQTALQSGDFDAAIVQATDGTVLCKVATESFPEENILVVAQATPLCDQGVNQTGQSVDEIWSPGTMSFVGSNNSRAYIDGWFDAAAQANTGPQRVAVVMGSQLAAQTRVMETAMAEFAEANPGYIVDPIYTDYSTPDAYNKTQTYLQGHPDTTLIMSCYTPDVSKGIVQAVDQAGLLGKTKIVDQGFGDFTFDQVEQGNIQFSTLFFPYNQMKLSLQAIRDAQKGDPNKRFVDDSLIGTAEEPFLVTPDTVSQVPDELRG